MKYLIFIAIVVIILIYLTKRFMLIKVSGPSMNPTLKDGDVLLVDRKCNLNINNIVVSKDPEGFREFLVKRINKLGEGDFKGKVFLLGDNFKCSRDSRSFGYVDTKDVIGKVVKVWEKKN